MTDSDIRLILAANSPRFNVFVIRVQGELLIENWCVALGGLTFASAFWLRGWIIASLGDVGYPITSAIVIAGWLGMLQGYRLPIHHPLLLTRAMELKIAEVRSQQEMYLRSVRSDVNLIYQRRQNLWRTYSQHSHDPNKLISIHAEIDEATELIQGIESDREASTLLFNDLIGQLEHVLELIKNPAACLRLVESATVVDNAKKSIAAAKETLAAMAARSPITTDELRTGLKQLSALTEEARNRSDGLA